MKYLLSIILIVIFGGCLHNSSVEKHLSHSGNVMDVKGLVKEIVIDSPLVSGMTIPYIMDKYLILSDHQSQDNLVFVFDKKDFSYIAGAVHPGEGPNEITMIGELILKFRTPCYTVTYESYSSVTVSFSALYKNQRIS